jgi:glycosyltransferase involved in cell wall biosynthesis
MKIIFTTDNIHRGGKERQLFILTRSLLDTGSDVRIITRDFSKENYLTEYGLDNGLTYIYRGKTWLEGFHLFNKIVIIEKPDILISWDLQTSIFALSLYKKNNFVFINASIQHGIRLFRLSHILRSLVCFISPNIIANSLAGLRANNLRPDKRRFVLYNGIETKFLNNLTKAEVENLRKKLIPGYLDNQGIVYISVANFVPYKDYFTVFKALVKLKGDFVFYYLILGDGPMKIEIEKAIIKFGLETRVFLIGKTENVRDYLFSSDIMIHSSRGEGISNAILEGMFAGLPIIATNVGGVPETVFPGSSMLFPYKDDKALLNCLLKAPALFKDFDPGSEEYKNYLEKFSLESMVKRFEAIINVVNA